MKNKKHHYLEHQSEYEIPFYDLDPMNIMWHGNYIKYLEKARCAFLEEIRYNYDTMREQGFLWPVAQLEIKYIKPCKFRQKIKIQLAILEYQSFLRIAYTIYDATTQEKLTSALSTQIAVNQKTQQSQWQTPEKFQKAIETHPNYRHKDTP